MALNWTDSWQYKRLMEVIEEYWLTQPEEARVEVDLHFLHQNGETQEKHIIWINPNLNELSERAKATRNEYFRAYRKKQREGVKNARV